MASKKSNTAQKAKVQQADNSVVYKVMAALFALCFGLIELRALRRYYPTIAGLEKLYPLLPYFLYGGFALCVISLAVLLILRKSNVAKAICPWCAFVFGMVGLTGLSMTKEFTDGFYTLYFLWGIVFVQYIIYQLYRWEFFLFSLPTVSAGFLFFQLTAPFSVTLRHMIPLAVAVASLVCAVLVPVLASKNKGCLTIKGKRVRIFPKTYNPFLHYIVVGLWVICILAAFLLGGLFAYYCMFAAIAVEFIAAVYYTFQLN